MTFSGIHTAYSGMRTNQHLVDVAAGNVANVGTDGYVRRSAATGTLPGGPGSGATVTSTARVRSRYTERRLLDAAGDDGAAAARADTMLQLETAMLGDGRLTVAATMTDLLTAFEDLAGNPTSAALRSQVLAEAERFAGHMRQTAGTLTQARVDNAAAISEEVGELNDTTGRIAQLNQRIAAAGGPNAAPDLADERDRLSVRAAELMGVHVQPDDDGQIRILAGGIPLVDGPSAKPVSYDAATGTFAVGPDLMPITAGGSLQARAQLDTVDLPGHQAQLDAAAADIATQINTLHAAGQGDDAVTGRNLFTAPSAAGFAVDAAVAGNPAALAATPAGGGRFDGTTASSIAALADASTGPTATLNRYAGTIATDTSAAVATADAALGGRIAAQDAVDMLSGVSIDEELTNLTAAQTAFEASARVFTAVDSLLDTLINRTGLVGR